MNDMENFFKSSFKVKFDESLYELLDKCLVGILAGELDKAVTIRAYLRQAIHVEELNGAYRLIYEIFLNNRLFTASDVSKLQMDSNLFSNILDTGIDSYVKKNMKAFQDWITSTGMDFNFDSAKGVEDFTNFLYGQTIKTFREISENNPIQAEEYTISLARELKSRAINEMLGYIGEINSKGLMIGKTVLRGSDDAISMSNRLINYIDKRYSWQTIKAQKYTIDDIKDAESLKSFKERELENMGGKNLFFKHCYDMHLGKLNLNAEVGDIITLVADEGTGKTKWLIDQIFYALSEGKNVMLICTETPKYTILAMLQARVVKHKLNFSISEREIIQLPSHIDGMYKIGDVAQAQEYEDVLTQVEEAFTEWLNDEKTGTISLRQSATYYELYNLVREYQKDHYGDIIAIDSISFLDKSDMTSERRGYVDQLMETMKECGTNLHMTFLMTTHTGLDASKAYAKGKEVGNRVASDSSTVTKLSTVILVMRTTPELKKDNLMILIGKKLRYRKDQINTIILERDPVANEYKYVEEKQLLLQSTDDITVDQKYI